MKDKIEKVKTSLQIEEDINLHATGWVVQRIGWALMLVFITLAALGLFGNGTLSSKEISHGETTVEYERFTRRQNNTQVEIESQSSNGRIEVALSEPFMRTFKIEKIIPNPAEQKIVGGSNVYVFPADGGGKVTLFVMARHNGDVNATIRVNETDFQFHTFIYP